MKNFIPLQLKYCGLCTEDYIEVFVSEEEVPGSNPSLTHSVEMTFCGMVVSYMHVILQGNCETSPKLAASREQA